jgi:hypothetical protein
MSYVTAAWTKRNNPQQYLADLEHAKRTAANGGWQRDDGDAGMQAAIKAGQQWGAQMSANPGQGPQSIQPADFSGYKAPQSTSMYAPAAPVGGSLADLQQRHDTAGISAYTNRVQGEYDTEKAARTDRAKAGGSYMGYESMPVNPDGTRLGNPIVGGAAAYAERTRNKTGMPQSFYNPLPSEQKSAPASLPAPASLAASPLAAPKQLSAASSDTPTPQPSMMRARVPLPTNPTPQPTQARGMMAMESRGPLGGGAGSQQAAVPNASARTSLNPQLMDAGGGLGANVQMPTFQNPVQSIGQPGMGTYQGSSFPYLNMGSQSVTLPTQYLGGGSGGGGGGVNPQLAQQLFSSYQNAYNEGRTANETRYNDLIGFLNQRYTRNMERSEGLGDADRERIDRDYTRLGADTDQDMISRGLRNSTVRGNSQRGVEEDRQYAHRQLGESLRREQIGIDLDSSKDVLDAMERRTDSYPSMDQMAQLALQLGQGGYGPGGGGGGVGGSGGSLTGLPPGALGPSNTTQGPGYTQTSTLVPPSGGAFPGTPQFNTLPQGYGFYQQAMNNPSDYGYNYGGQQQQQMPPVWIQTGNGLIRNPYYGGSAG